MKRKVQNVKGKQNRACWPLTLENLVGKKTNENKLIHNLEAK